MANILYLETATRVCSVGLSKDEHLVALREDHSMQYSHSSQLTVFMEQVMQEGGCRFSELDAVAVSQGPGSYTGLRIGVSAAKGVCYALDIPLIAVETLQSMAYCGAPKLVGLNPEPAFLVPMIDARRMEVYNAVFDSHYRQVRATMAEIIDGNAFADYLQAGRVAFWGDGAAKCQEIIRHPNALFLEDIHPGVVGMMAPVLQKFHQQKFENLAYFEPFYLKDFVAGAPKVKGLHA